jgi:purine-cytosine permease-like protein
MEIIPDSRDTRDARDTRDTRDEDARDTRHQHHQFYMQAGFSGLGVVFSATMLLIGKEPSIYLPIFTSILFSWLPSPLSGAVGASTVKKLTDVARATVVTAMSSSSRMLTDRNGSDGVPMGNFKVQNNPSFYV